MSRKKKGQSTLEYIIIFGVVIAAIVIFATTVLQVKLGDSLKHVAEEAGKVVNRIHY